MTNSQGRLKVYVVSPDRASVRQPDTRGRRSCSDRHGVVLFFRSRQEPGANIIIITTISLPERIKIIILIISYQTRYTWNFRTIWMQTIILEYSNGWFCTLSSFIQYDPRACREENNKPKFWFRHWNRANLFLLFHGLHATMHARYGLRNTNNCTACIIFLSSSRRVSSDIFLTRKYLRESGRFFVPK